jgi:energy-converting hydrogenase Eha subunit B
MIRNSQSTLISSNPVWVGNQFTAFPCYCGDVGSR